MSEIPIHTLCYDMNKMHVSFDDEVARRSVPCVMVFRVRQHTYFQWTKLMNQSQEWEN